MCLLLAWGLHMPPQLCMCHRHVYSLLPYIAPHNHREALGMLRHEGLCFALHVAGLMGPGLPTGFALENPGYPESGTPPGLHPHAGAGRL